MVLVSWHCHCGNGKALMSVDLHRRGTWTGMHVVLLGYGSVNFIGVAG
jgi:hypothetical protein